MSVILAMMVALGQPPVPIAGGPAAAGQAASLNGTGPASQACVRGAAEDAPGGCCDAPGRAELEAELAFLERAEAAFLFSHRSTTEVKRRIRAIEQQLASLAPHAEEREQPERPEPRDGPAPISIERCIEELEADLAFLERAEAAFFHSHRSTAQVTERIRAVEECLQELRGARPGSPG